MNNKFLIFSYCILGNCAVYETPVRRREKYVEMVNMVCYTESVK